MALFKPYKGSRTGLSSVAKKDGNAYFCIDDGSFWIDYTDSNGAVQRKQISASEAETLGGKTVDEIIAMIPDVDGKISTHNKSTSAHSDIRTLANNAQSAANQAQSVADAAQSTANTAVSDAGKAQEKADAATIAAATAQSRADEAYALAESKADSLSDLGITATAAELNKLDGVTATTAELNYVDGVTSNIQTQLDAKVPTSRTVNGKALSSDITLSASDVGADLYVGSSAPSNTENILWVDTSVDESDLYYTKDETDAFLANKAPAGYGLGTDTAITISSVKELDNYTANGWYKFYCQGSCLNNIWFNYAFVRVSNYGKDSHCLQEIYPVGFTSPIVRCLLEGVWGEPECDNPPMVPGVEYRTTQRLNGAAVYTKYIHHGKGSSDGVVNINPGIDGSYHYFSTNIKAIGDNGWGGYINDSRVSINDSGLIYITMGADASGLDFYATIKYQK